MARILGMRHETTVGVLDEFPKIENMNMFIQHEYDSSIKHG